jgi:hypothetical protein
LSGLAKFFSATTRQMITSVDPKHRTLEMAWIAELTRQNRKTCWQHETMLQ